jgi:hypothetical protein
MAPEKSWCLVDEGDYSSLFPGNGARKELDCWLIALEKSWWRVVE